MADIFKAVLDISLAASALAFLALLARLVIGRRPNALLPLLSALVILRLVMPAVIPSPVSVMNLFSYITAEQPASEVPINVNETEGYEFTQPEVNTYVNTAANAEIESGIQPEAVDPVENVSGNNASVYKPPVKALSFMDIASIIWVAGMAAMAACIAASNIRFTLTLKKNRRYDSPGFKELLEQCKEQLNIRGRIEAVQLSGINTAAVYGILRPRLLISPSFGWLSDEEKRHVLLHELSHIRRRDTLVCLLITVLNAVYWFNPVVWAALALARRDMEIMCDMAVLKLTQDKRSYASTLFSLAKASNNTKPKLVTALFIKGPQNALRFGVLVSTDSIKRRMKMITRYKRSRLLTAVSIILVIAIAVTGCTGAVSGNENATKESVSPEAEFTTPEIEGQKLIASYSLDFSSIADDEARVANIKKATEMLDGTIFPHKDEYLSINEDMKRQIDVPGVFGAVTEKAGWKNAAWTGWGSVDIYIHENDNTSGYFKPMNEGEIRTQTGGGLEVAAMAYYRAAALAGLDCGSCYTGGPGDMEEYASGNSKYSEPPEDNIDNGGVSAVNNNYVSDLILRMWVENNCVTAAFYAEGTAEQVPVPTIDPDDWRQKFRDKFTTGAAEQTENSYRSSNISVTIENVQKDGVTYFVADIYVADLKHFRTAFPGDADVMGGRETTDKAARDVGAILAINGVQCIATPGTVVHNGKLYREEASASDVLVMNYDGSMQTYSPDEFDMGKIKTEGAYQVWSFGPMLLKDEKPMTEFNSTLGGKNPRTAVGYYEPGHYCFVVVDGRQPGYSDGFTLTQLSQLFAELGCKAAYNMDGGNTTEMAFLGNLINKPCNGGRKAEDIIYIVE